MAKELITTEGAQRGNLFKLRPEDVVIVGIDTPHKKGEHPLWDERITLPVEEGMVLSIMALGVRQVIEVAVYDGAPFVIDGRQRVRAARVANERLRKLGEPEVTVRVAGDNVKRISEGLLMETMVALNEQRRDDDVLVKAAKAERMRSRGLSDERIAIAFGVSTQAIRNWAKLSGLSPEVKDAVRDGVLTAHAASALSELPVNEQAAAVVAVAATGAKPTATKIKDKVKPAPSGEGRPGGRVVRKILALEAPELPDGFVLALKWLRGEIPATKIKGLSAVLRGLEKAKAE